MWDQSVAPFQNGLALIWRDTGLIGLSCHLELFFMQGVCMSFS